MNPKLIDLILELSKSNLPENTTGLSARAPLRGGDRFKGDLWSDYIGQYVLIRSWSEGINAGFLEMASEHGCVLRDARRLHYHVPNNKSLSWYEGVSISGLESDSRVSGAVAQKVIIEKYSITPCTLEAQQSIQGFPIHPTSC